MQAPLLLDEWREDSSSAGNKRTQKPYRLDLIEHQHGIPGSAQVHILLCVSFEYLRKLGRTVELQLLHECTVTMRISMLGSLRRMDKKLAILAETLPG